MSSSSILLAPLTSSLSKAIKGLIFMMSLVDGYNLPMMVVARGGTREGCSSTGCLVGLNGVCPAELMVARGNSNTGSVACKSACEAFGDLQYCCSEGYSTPDVVAVLQARVPTLVQLRVQ
ncbi:pathogenesis-related thaumatin superfamily protein [Actinidia rufa]|uniref:Pathogenesis-related thaumatin superfamily protein n=1 Tax=Actinidia rufa TaxID=165716 RepID=A0A7J0D8E0_9ERIC|nr:pathogenesis-related thaumatin superfamily protein [Actinidia rufa]GFZ00538.1 pathogenesis-related thaumatin superfamily protein [Actinidia rufa]